MVVLISMSTILPTISPTIEKNYCIYCKRPIFENNNLSYHQQCQTLVKKYNNGIIVKIKKKLQNNRFLTKKFNWTRNKILFYKIYYSLGGFYIFVILIYELLAQFKL